MFHRQCVSRCAESALEIKSFAHGLRPLCVCEYKQKMIAKQKLPTSIPVVWYKAVKKMSRLSCICNWKSMSTRIFKVRSWTKKSGAIFILLKLCYVYMFHLFCFFKKKRLVVILDFVYMSCCYFLACLCDFHTVFLA